MSEFIDFEASVEDNKNEEKDEEVSDNDLDSLSSFIDEMKLKMTEYFIKNLKRLLHLLTIF